MNNAGEGDQGHSFEGENTLAIVRGFFFSLSFFSFLFFLHESAAKGDPPVRVPPVIITWF